MTRWLLDTNVVSNLIKPERSESLTTWMAGQSDLDLHISAMTVAEIARGIRQMDDGRKKRALEVWFAGPSGPLALFGGRVLAFDQAAAMHWAVLVADGRRSGIARDAIDMIIAATALANDCTVVTDNERHFRDVVPMLNPVRGES